MKALQHITHGTVFLGRKRGFNLRAPSLSNYGNASTLAYPPMLAWERPIAWQMLGNDTVGDCVIARLLHQIMGWFSVANAGQPKTFSTDQALQIYSAITGYVPGDPSTDNGTDPDAACTYWQNTGIFGDKIAGYANVDITNIDLIRFAMATFGGVGLAFDVPAYIMQVPAGGDWSETPGVDTTIEGGHEIYLVGYGRRGFRAVSWGSTYTFDLNFLGKYGQNIDAVVSPDWIKQSGVSPSGLNLSGLLADLPTAPTA
jgi:hypothetical protein